MAYEQEGDFDKLSWEKYEGKYKLLISFLAWADDVARRVSQSSGVMVCFFRRPQDYFSFFYAKFKTEGMSDKEKMKEVGKSLDAIDLAYNELDNYEEWEKFEEQYFR